MLLTTKRFLADIEREEHLVGPNPDKEILKLLSEFCESSMTLQCLCTWSYASVDGHPQVLMWRVKPNIKDMLDNYARTKKREVRNEH